MVDQFSPGKTRPFNACATTTSQPRFQGTQQYSITALTDSTGTIKERYAYSAYGGLTITDASGTVRASSAEGNRYTYTGREWDDVTEIYHFRARPYLPRVGRFGSRDPIGFTDGFSVYTAYMYLTQTDPSGLSCTLIDRWQEIYFRVHGILAEGSLDSSPGNVGQKDLDESLCVCQLLDIAKYKCKWKETTEDCEGNKVVKDRMDIRTKIKSRMYLHRMPIKVTALCGSPISVPLPGNQGIGLWLCDLHPGFDARKGYERCKTSCMNAHKRQQAGGPKPPWGQNPPDPPNKTPLFSPVGRPPGLNPDGENERTDPHITIRPGKPPRVTSWSPPSKK
jgi:RHS repeat-associated protein